MMNNVRQPLGCRQCGAVKFVHTFLPEAKKPYNLKAVHQPELDVHGIASKADIITVHGYGLKIESDEAHRNEE